KTPSVLAEEEVGPASIGGVRSRRRVVPRRAGRNAHDGRAAAVRGGQGPRDRTEGAALGRADDGPRSRRGGSPSSRRLGLQGQGRGRGLCEPSASRGPRGG